MARDLAVLVALIVVGAGWMTLHLAMLLRVLRDKQQPLGWKLGALLPVLTPIAAWRSQIKVRSVLWYVHGAVYLGLWYGA